MTLSWNFPATSHDKGIVDGTGGMVMRTNNVQWKNQSEYR